MADDPDRDDLIRERAYRIWLDEGCPEGCADEHWRRAADELDGQLTTLHDLDPASAPVLPPTR